MISSTRRRLYAISIIGLVLALWLRPAPEIAATVLPARPSAPTPSQPLPVAVAVSSLPLLTERRGSMPGGLFAAPPRPPQQAPMVEVIGEPVSIAPDLQMLGWVQAGQVHWVSVMSNSTNYTLQPGEQVEEHFRYEGVRDEMAVFTHLRDGTTREYPISDTTISDQD